MKKQKEEVVQQAVPDWTRKLAGCFGSQTHKFGNDPSDKDYAFELLAQLRAEGVRWSEVRKEFRRFLRDLGASKAHSEKQMDRLRSHFRLWLK